MKSRRMILLIAGIALLLLAGINFPDQIESNLLVAFHWPVDSLMIGQFLFVALGLFLFLLGIFTKEKTKT